MMDLLKHPALPYVLIGLLVLGVYGIVKLFQSFYRDLEPGPDRTRLAVALTISTIKNFRRAVTNSPAPPEPPARKSNPKFSGTISEPIRPPFTHTKHEGEE